MTGKKDDLGGVEAAASSVDGSHSKEDLPEPEHLAAALEGFAAFMSPVTVPRALLVLCEDLLEAIGDRLGFAWDDDLELAKKQLQAHLECDPAKGSHTDDTTTEATEGSERQ